MQNQQQMTPARFIAPSNLFSVVRALQDPLQIAANIKKQNKPLPADPQKFQTLLNNSITK